MNKKGAGKFILDFEIIVGIIILLIGAVLLLDYYKYLPRAFPIPKDMINFSAGIVCAASGLILTIKKLFARERGF